MNHVEILYKPIITHSTIARRSWSQLYYYCKFCDPQGSGKISLSWKKSLEDLKCDRSSLYRWLQEGQKDGGFRAYKKRKDSLVIYLGSKRVITEGAGRSDWGAAIAISREELLEGEPLRILATKAEVYRNQERSRIAAIREAQRSPRFQKYSSKARGKAIEAKLTRLDGESKTPYLFVRRRLPYGGSQQRTARSLGISDRTVRRHLEGVKRKQQLIKISYQEAWIDQEMARETGRPRRTFFTKKEEAFKYGCNLYDLRFPLKSEFSQRLKYKFNLLEKISLRRISSISSPYDLSISVGRTLSISFPYELSDLLNSLNEDWIAEYIDTLIPAKNFKEFESRIRKIIHLNQRPDGRAM